MLLHQSHLFHELWIVVVDLQPLPYGSECGIIKALRNLRHGQAIVALDEGRIQADAFLGIFRGGFPLLQSGIRRTAIGEVHMIGGLLLYGLRVVLYSLIELLSCKRFISQTAIKGIVRKVSTKHENGEILMDTIRHVCALCKTYAFRSSADCSE